MFKDRLEWLLKKNKMRSSELAERLGVSKSTVTKWTNGDAIPRHPILHEITNIFSVSIGYLLGEGDIANNPPPSFTVGYSLNDSGSAESYTSKFSIDVNPSIVYTQDEPEPIDNFLWIPLYETKISATPGVQDIVREDIIGWHTAPKTSEHDGRNPLERPFSMRVTGDSMTPNIMPNDYLTIKPAPFIIPESRGLYAVKIEDKSTNTFGIVVKRVQIDEERGIYLLKSDNPAYPVYIVDSEKAAIIGKIVSIWRKL